MLQKCSTLRQKSWHLKKKYPGLYELTNRVFLRKRIAYFIFYSLINTFIGFVIGDGITFGIFCAILILVIIFLDELLLRWFFKGDPIYVSLISAEDSLTTWSDSLISLDEWFIGNKYRSWFLLPACFFFERGFILRKPVMNSIHYSQLNNILLIPTGLGWKKFFFVTNNMIYDGVGIIYTWRRKKLINKICSDYPTIKTIKITDDDLIEYAQTNRLYLQTSNPSVESITAGFGKQVEEKAVDLLKDTVKKGLINIFRL
jgi:hypothetical protein